MEKTLKAKLSIAIPEEPLDLARVEHLRGLVDLARRIETLQGELAKKAKTSSWEAKAAEELGFDLDEGKSKKRKSDDGDDNAQNREAKKMAGQLNALKAEFKAMKQQLNL